MQLSLLQLPLYKYTIIIIIDTIMQSQNSHNYHDYTCVHLYKNTVHNHHHYTIMQLHNYHYYTRYNSHCQTHDPELITGNFPELATGPPPCDSCLVASKGRGRSKKQIKISGSDSLRDLPKCNLPSQKGKSSSNCYLSENILGSGSVVYNYSYFCQFF